MIRKNGNYEKNPHYMDRIHPRSRDLQNHQLQVGVVAGLVDPAMKFCALYLERQGRLQKRHPCHNEQSVKRMWASLSIL